MMYYMGVMQWVIGKLYVFILTGLVRQLTSTPSAWLFFKLMNVSGAEAVIAAASPWIGQGNFLLLVMSIIEIYTFVTST